MGTYVHRALTKKWALQAGFSAETAEQISLACYKFDGLLWSKLWCHFAILGAWPAGKVFLFVARRRHSAKLLGYAVHCAQDSIGHGWVLPWNHTPDLDDWNAAGAAKQQKIEQVSLTMLRRFA